MNFGQETFDIEGDYQCDINDHPADEFDFEFFSLPSTEIEIQPYIPPPLPPPPPPPQQPIAQPPVENIFSENPLPQRIMTYDQFVKYIYSKIDPDDALLITKEMLMKLEKPFAEEFGCMWNKLRRDDKRKKERVLQRFYENVNIIYLKLETEPDKYLFYVKESIIKKYGQN